MSPERKRRGRGGICIRPVVTTTFAAPPQMICLRAADLHMHRLTRNAYLLLILLLALPLLSQNKPIVWSAQEKPLADQIHSLRKLPDDERARVTKQLALNIRALPV